MLSVLAAHKNRQNTLISSCYVCYRIGIHITKNIIKVYDLYIIVYIKWIRNISLIDHQTAAPIRHFWCIPTMRICTIENSRHKEWRIIHIRIISIVCPWIWFPLEPWEFEEDLLGFCNVKNESSPKVFLRNP